MTFYRARLESWRFDFTAYGQTKEAAIDALKKGLEQHAKDYAIDSDWWHEIQNDIYTIEVGLGGCYRDNSPILETP